MMRISGVTNSVYEATGICIPDNGGGPRLCDHVFIPGSLYRQLGKFSGKNLPWVLRSVFLQLPSSSVKLSILSSLQNVAICHSVVTQANNQ
jgi:hypothetical protein